MSSFIEYTIYLSPFQKRKIKKCFKAKQKCQIRVNHSRKNDREPVQFLLNQRQVNKIEKLKKENKGCDIDVSYKQLVQNGGFLPFLIPLAVALGKAALTSGAAALGTYAGKKVADKITGNSGGALKLPGKIGGGALRLPGTQKIVEMGNLEVPKKRGRPKKLAENVEVPKKRGRPKKLADTAVSSSYPKNVKRVKKEKIP